MLSALLIEGFELNPTCFIKLYFYTVYACKIKVLNIQTLTIFFIWLFISEDFSPSLSTIIKDRDDNSFTVKWTWDLL